MPVQRALRLAGGAGGVDHQRRIVRRGVGRREIGGGARDRLGEAERAIGGPVGREHEQLRDLATDLVELGEPLRVGDDGLHARIRQSVAQRIDAKENGKRHGDRAKLVDRDVPDRRLRRLRQQHRDAIAARNAVRRQRVGEPVGLLAQPAEADLFGPAVGADVEDREPVRIGLGPLVADIDADVVARKLRPAEFAVQLVVVADVRQHGKVLVVRF